MCSDGLSYNKYFFQHNKQLLGVTFIKSWYMLVFVGSNVLNQNVNQTRNKIYALTALKGITMCNTVSLPEDYHLLFINILLSHIDR